MNDSWTVEVHNRGGQTRVHQKDVTPEEALQLATLALKNDEVGGVVIYRSIGAGKKEGGEKDDQRLLGLVGDAPVAGGNRLLTYCKYCEMTGGHTAGCVVIS
jgi:hypothetical protein